ncbi:asparagine synthase (glutamine-hydrolyzing) [Shewanella sp. T24-MNA-CIBAN-0130]|uniref:asparagine synthase (glutamine-hydrolyzing) n=1 Tax=Shewanella sp. T24-MNA-CIBAN-0130 TaxID=3140470 RepID=UPI0033264A50
MCGFAGVIHSSVKSFSTSTLQKMLDAIKHRGPDDAGLWSEENIFLGHRRLSIHDLSTAGHQPMQSKSGRFTIIFNGEIYNFEELRAQLPSILWEGRSDTEVMLHAFEVWGIEKALRSFNGMFAFALWDKQEKILTLARDRMGEKPLYWGWCDDTLLFGSELKALKVHPSFNAKINRSALALLMQHNYIPAPYSIYEGIEKLCPGQYVQIKVGQTRNDVIPKHYWQLNTAIESGIKQPFTGTDEQAVDLLENTLKQAVSSQMLADVPLGAFLSGGVDSSTIVALMVKSSSLPVKTFAIGFDEPGYNEAVFAKEVAQHLGTEHTEFYVSAKDALELIPKLPEMYCEPFADSSQLPTYLVCKMAKQHVTVALSGDGGDELFGGYNPYQFSPKIWAKVKLLPLSLRDLLFKVLSGSLLPDKLNKLLAVFPAKDKEHFYQLLMSHWQHPQQLVIGAQPLPTLLNAHEKWPKTDSFEHWMMAMDAGQYMPEDILVKVDRAAMANSLETRVPLLDHRVVELAWQLPLHLKIRNDVGKWVLREVLYRHVPRELIERPKKGFAIPLAQWLRGPLKEWAETLLDEQRLIQEGYFHPELICTYWLEHLSGKRDHSTRLWGVLMFQAWLEKQ